MVERFVVVDDEDVEQDESHIPADRRSDTATALIVRLIIIDLAKGMQHKDIAAKYGYETQSVTNIKYRHKAKVAEMKAIIEAKQADLVVSVRASAVMGYEKQIAEIEAELDAMRDGRHDWDSHAFAKMQQLITQIRKLQLEALNPKFGHGGTGGQSLKVTWKGVDVAKLLDREGVSSDD
jgi:hypothetical protein